MQEIADSLCSLYSVGVPDTPMREQTAIDGLDRRILLELAASPRIGHLELSRRLGVARGTVTARLDKLRRRGVITGFGPDLDLEALGYPVQAFSTVTVTQGRLHEVIGPLEEVPEVLEVNVTTGDADLLVRIAARSNRHLLEVLEGILALDYVDRASSAIVLATPVEYRTRQLLEAQEGEPRSRDGRPRPSSGAR